ncbi:ATP-binding protein [uncultured Tateyamaria sp.]|uniref:ATP-binding protein n=1 Tax=uncultured Tateyamaria sp. TaxID=455651 RepID=UPI002612DCEC|nr:ATP-binding protein [uncultured Tateyamaria sp.]
MPSSNGSFVRTAAIDALRSEGRVGRRSTIVAAQMPVSKWHDYLGGDATADAIMDRLVHSSEKIELKDASLRAKSQNDQLDAEQDSDG